MVSKRAAEHLATEYRETLAKLSTLDNEIAELDGKREAHRIKLDWLKTQVDPSAIQGLPSPAAELPAKPVAAQPGGDTTSDDGTPRGLRYAIRAVLKNASRGMRPRDIHGELVKRGTAFSEGKSPPLTRTHNELYRMSKVGQIRKRGSLYYPHETMQ
jgi:hypothetical protein